MQSVIITCQTIAISIPKHQIFGQIMYCMKMMMGENETKVISMLDATYENISSIQNYSFPLLFILLRTYGNVLAARHSIIKQILGCLV